MKMQFASAKLLGLVAAAVVMTGCATSNMTSVAQSVQGVTTSSSNALSNMTGNSEPATIKTVSCSTPQRVVSLAPLQCRASSCQPRAEGAGNIGALIAYSREQEGIPDLVGFGDGMTDMLTSAMAATGCFDLLDRELMAELAREQELSGRKVSMPGADMLATGSITSLSYDRSRSSIGGGFVPVIGGVTTSRVTAKIGMDVRVVDVDTGRVSYTRTYNAESGKRGFGMAGGGLVGGGILAGGHSVKGGVEMEEAAREIIQNVVVDMVENMLEPDQYRVSHLQAAK